MPLNREKLQGPQRGHNVSGSELLLVSFLMQISGPFPMFMAHLADVLDNIWVFPKIGVPQNGWFIMENPIKLVQLFLETPIFCIFEA